MKPTSISAIVHTYNEEANIARCLTSLAFADEIIVIDMESTDGTRRVAREYTKKIFTFPKAPIVEPARNFGIEKGIGPWILIVDADETVPRTLALWLKEQAAGDEYAYYRLPRKNIIFDRWIKHTGWWPDYQVRFFKKGSVVWTEKIHGVPQTRGIGFDTEPIEELALEHHNYHSVSQYVERMNRYSTVAAKDAREGGAVFSQSALIQNAGKEFIRRYFAWEGNKDHDHGISLSLLQSFSEVITQLKVWELEGFKKKAPASPDASGELTALIKELYEWIGYTKAKQSGNPAVKIFWKIRTLLRRLVL